MSHFSGPLLIEAIARFVGEVLEEASDSTLQFIQLLGETGSWLGAATRQAEEGGGQFGLGRDFVQVDGCEIRSHHFETLGNQCLLVFTVESSFQGLGGDSCPATFQVVLCIGFRSHLSCSHFEVPIVHNWSVAFGNWMAEHGVSLDFATEAGRVYPLGGRRLFAGGMQIKGLEPRRANAHCRQPMSFLGWVYRNLGATKWITFWFATAFVLWQGTSSFRQGDGGDLCDSGATVEVGTSDPGRVLEMQQGRWANPLGCDKICSLNSKLIANPDRNKYEARFTRRCTSRRAVLKWRGLACSHQRLPPGLPVRTRAECLRPEAAFDSQPVRREGHGAKCSVDDVAPALVRRSLQLGLRISDSSFGSRA